MGVSNELIALAPEHEGEVDYFHCCVEKALAIFETARLGDAVDEEFVLEVLQAEEGLVVEDVAGCVFGYPGVVVVVELVGECFEHLLGLVVEIAEFLLSVNSGLGFGVDDSLDTIHRNVNIDSERQFQNLFSDHLDLYSCSEES